MGHCVASPSLMVIAPRSEKLLKHLSFRYYHYNRELSLFQWAGEDNSKLQTIEHYAFENCLLYTDPNQYYWYQYSGPIVLMTNNIGWGAVLVNV